MNLLNVTELYTLKWLQWRILGCVYFTTLPQQQQKKKQQADPCWRDPRTGSMMKTKMQDGAENQMTGCKFI